MNPARMVVLAIAVAAGGIAAYLASGSDKRPAAPLPVAQMQAVDVLVAESDIGQTVKPDDLQWQAWPAAIASGTFIEATTQTLARSRGLGVLSPALRSIADVKRVEQADEEGPRLRRGESVKVVRYAIVNPTTVQQ